MKVEPEGLLIYLLLASRKLPGVDTSGEIDSPLWSVPSRTPLAILLASCSGMSHHLGGTGS